MKQIVLEQLIMMAPALLEVGFDHLCWKLGWNEKVLSTYVFRPVVGLIAIVLVVSLYEEPAYQVAPVVIWYHLLLFNYLINWSLRRKFFYLGQGPFDRLLAKVHDFPRLWIIQIFPFVVFQCIYYYW